MSDCRNRLEPGEDQAIQSRNCIMLGGRQYYCRKHIMLEDQQTERRNSWPPLAMSHIMDH